MMLKKIVTVTVLGTMLAVSFPVLAEETRGTNTPINRQLNLACMQTAVEKRDNAMITATDKFSVAVKSALEKRRDALKSAWGLTDRTARRTAIKKSWSDFRTDHRKATTDFRKERRVTWQQFVKDRKSCGLGASNDDPATENSEIPL